MRSIKRSGKKKIEEVRQTMADSTFSCKSFYTVTDNDTLHHIAEQFQVSLSALVQANDMRVPYPLWIGQTLCIPGMVEAMQENQDQPEHCVEGTLVTINNEQLIDLLRPGQLTFADVVCANPGIDLTKPLQNGMQLCVPARSRYIGPCNVDQSYIIISGDNLDTIARRLDVTSDALLIHNPEMRVRDFRERGVRICIPTAAEASAILPQQIEQNPQRPCDQILYTVEFENLTRILENFDINFGSLYCYNPQIDFSLPLAKGTQLCIPRRNSFQLCIGGDYYIIRANDSIDVISRKIGVSLLQLLISNPNFSIDDFSEAGIRICIPIAR